ncbi:MAG: DNA-binding Lrp family transcriptional regulator [Methanobacteriota archaeon]|jgi:DNA-binding Lrp family transcriptional regulator|uniref:Lrp/AsnC family transcriptional regulator n=1 Tax=Halorutilus salinus TaxID=2487751 RepID=A0A9Q4GIM8_9EURY|nr:Lrp/AsnC family transcriptional regulator [Halorutilus salinus]MCX2818978.1 Lrp/AsnC family transcriptional regulator [Halorutilus salinus]
MNEEKRRELVEVLADDARRSTDDLARMLDASADDVEKEIEALEDEGVLRGYTAVVDWEEFDDDRAEAYVEVNVSLDRETDYVDIADRIARFPEVTSLTLVSGNYDFGLTVEADSMNDVSAFVSEKVAPVPEITQTVTHFVMDKYKERGFGMGDGDDDERLSVSP